MKEAGMTVSAAQIAYLAQHSLKTTTGSENPRYSAYWTSEKQLEIFAQSLTADPLFTAMLPLPPSSTIIVEFAKATSGSDDLTASLFINDV
jgi:hypothetical protein